MNKTPKKHFQESKYAANIEENLLLEHLINNMDDKIHYIQKQDREDKQGQSILLEQYKMYVEMADRVSNRRIEANKFYISLLTGLLALISIVNIPTNIQKIITGVIAILGTILCFVWVVNIRSYRELNSLKFQVIHEMEQKLPFRCYDREWEILKTGTKRRSYFRLTRIEQYVPLLLLIPYIILLVYAIML